MKDYELEYEKWVAEKLSHLVCKYSSNGMYYHTFNHVLECLDCLTRPELQEFDTPIMRWAIYYHDCIYNPKSSTNEEDSANYACSDLIGLLSGIGFKNINTLLTVRDLILATKHTKVVVTDKLEKCILDIDLSAFASTSDKFKENSDQIRLEYAHVSDSDFARGRTKVLQSFLDRPNIFYILTDLEKPARTNIQNEIMYLSGKF